VPGGSVPGAGVPGGSVPGSGAPAPTPVPLGAGASSTADGTTWVLFEDLTPSSFAGALLHALRRGAVRLVVFADHGAAVAARLAGRFRFDIEVRAVHGATSHPADPAPLPVVLPGPDGAEGLLEQLRAHDLEVVLEDGSWRGELLGLEVARIVVWPEETGGDGRLHLEAGVGRFDRDAAAAMHGGESPVAGLERAVRTVRERRHPGAPTHPLSLMARARWLRADALADPGLVGACRLDAAPTTFPATSVRHDVPAAALGATEGGDDLVVVFGAGAALDLAPVAADTRELLAPGARLRLVIAPRDHLPATDELAALLDPPVDVVEMAPGWS
jgi:hypothetical protein